MKTYEKSENQRGNQLVNPTHGKKKIDLHQVLLQNLDKNMSNIFSLISKLEKKNK